MVHPNHRREVKQVEILEWLLSRRDIAGMTASQATIHEWKEHFDRHCLSFENTMDRAVAGGFISDRVAYAFAAGFESALRMLVPGLPPGQIAAICVTEGGSTHPRAIETALTPLGVGCGQAWRLSGTKSFVTMAQEAQVMLVAASAGVSPDGRKDIRMVRLERSRPGIEVRPIEDLPLVPEVSHGEVGFRDVAVYPSDILPGDGYAGYVKPFRTVEDMHVLAGVLGYLVRCGRLFKWPHSTRESMLAVISGLRALASGDPGAPHVHLALAGSLRQAADLAESIGSLWEGTDPGTRSRWERDKKLLAIAAGARSARRKKAWEFFGESPADSPGG